MRFNLLGPLEVEQHGQAVPITGFSQRATLAFLLLHANEAVAVSRLTKALWEDRPPPTTAKKVLQNAVAGLRGVLVRADSAAGTVLLTHAPGYRLQLDPSRIDLTRFDRLVERGRTELAAGSWERAADLLRDALALWRGPALADLAEDGVRWPELTAVRNAHKAVLEDRMTAELALGRHHEVVADLEAALGLEPVRERLCSLLMLALYRCGRQAEALDVYRRTRTALVEVGLDPGRRLRELEQAILDHDPVLDVPAPGAWGEPAGITLLPRAPAERPTALRVAAALAVRTPCAASDPEEVHTTLATAEASIRAEVERYGGVVQSMLGSLHLAVFGSARTAETSPGDAVRAALALRAQLTGAGFAVTAGQVLVTADARTYGGVLDDAVALATAAEPGELRVDDDVRHTTDRRFAFRAAEPGWSFTHVRPAHSPERPLVPFVDREPELARLRDVLSRVRLHRRPRQVHVLGEGGLGKSRLVAEFRRATPAPVRFFVGRAQAFPRDGGQALLAELVASATEDPAPVALARLTAAAQAGPVVVVLEDVHHAAAPAAEFTDRLVAASAGLPLLVVTTGRVARETLTITLNPLSGNGITRLLGPLARRWPAERFGGNPHFAVEYLRDPDPAALPLAVVLSVAARLDDLTPTDRAVLEHVALAASPVPAVDFAGPDVLARVDRLVRQGFLRPAEDSTVTDVRYTFRDPLVGEVTASLIPRESRTPQPVL